MKKKFVLFFLIIILSCSTIFSHNLINIIYDRQGNKISLYDDHTWIVNDEDWNDEVNYYGKYVIKEEGKRDFAKMLLISEEIYPDTEEWTATLQDLNMGLEEYEIKDFMKQINFYVQISEKQMEFGYTLEGSSEKLILKRINPSLGQLGFYIQEKNLYIFGENRELLSLGKFTNSNTLKVDFINFFVKFKSPNDIDYLKNSFAGYEKYLSVTLEKE